MNRHSCYERSRRRGQKRICCRGNAYVRSWRKRSGPAETGSLEGVSGRSKASIQSCSVSVRQQARASPLLLQLRSLRGMREVGGGLVCGLVPVTRGLPPSWIVISSITDFLDVKASRTSLMFLPPGLLSQTSRTSLMSHASSSSHDHPWIVNSSITDLLDVKSQAPEGRFLFSNVGKKMNLFES